MRRYETIENAMEFRILGPLEVCEGEQLREVGGGRQRKLLAILLLRANEILSTDRLIDELWGATPPDTALKALQGHVSQLRKVLGSEVLVTQSPGYVLRVDPEQVDAYRFEELLERARHAEPKEASELCREALALWRGPALTDFAFEDFARSEVARLTELRFAALEEQIDADLELGRHADVVSELQAIVARYPLRERLRGQLMLALYRSGRQAEALEVYQDARRTLVDELGLEPGEELQRLQRAILAHDPTLAPPPRVGRPKQAPAFERVLRRPRLLIGAGALLLAGAITAAAFQLTGGSTAPAPLVIGDSVAVIDPSTNGVSAVVKVGTRPVAVATGQNAVWVANADDGTVSRIDPQTRQVVSTIGIGGDVGDVAIGFGSVWVADGNDGTLTRIDPKLNAVEATLRFGSPGDLSPQPIFSVAAGEGSVWATRGNSVVKIDPATNQTVARIPVTEPLAIAVGAGALWVTTAGERILRIDVASSTETAQSSLPSQGLAPAIWRGGLWLIVSIDQGSVWRFDPGSLFPTSTFRTAGAVDLAAGESAVWVADFRGGVWRIEPSSGDVTRIALAHHPVGIAAGDGLVWAAIS
jgi:YVTN family beta-propeller protein